MAESRPKTPVPPAPATPPGGLPPGVNPLQWPQPAQITLGVLLLLLLVGWWLAISRGGRAEEAENRDGDHATGDAQHAGHVPSPRVHRGARSAGLCDFSRWPHGRT